MVTLRAHRNGWRYRGNVAARIAAASLGGYGVAALAAFAAARGWPLDRLQATLLGTLLAFLVMPAAAIWAFLAASPTRAWVVLVASAVIFGAVGVAIGAR